MNFQDLINHIETNGCNYDHEEGNLYQATNCINAQTCQIEDLSFYSDITIMHYCYVLGIPSPEHLREQMDSYREMHRKIPAVMRQIEEDE